MAYRIDIKSDTFIKTGEDALTYKVKKQEYSHPYDIGTVQVELDGGRKVVTANAKRYQKDGGIYVEGFVGRYRTGGKVWRASVSTSNGGTRVWFGRDDRSGKFQKVGEVWFEPEMWAKA